MKTKKNALQIKKLNVIELNKKQVSKIIGGGDTINRPLPGGSKDTSTIICGPITIHD